VFVAQMQRSATTENIAISKTRGALNVGNGSKADIRLMSAMGG
jgi:hypothetical protein